jgi:pyruvate ferredoxin oxidoreductase alpha subunit
VRMAVTGMGLQGHTVIAGLGGRAITQKSLHALFSKAGRGELEPLTFLDLDWKVVNKHLERERQTRRSGPAAENILRDVGVVASRIG